MITLSCTNKSKLEQQLVEDTFLEIVDTLAYRRGTFVSLPKDTIRFPELSIKFSQKINYNKKVDEITNVFFERIAIDVSRCFKKWNKL